ncbi:MAG: Lrp/AsnC family transcriptional regulator [Deferribacteres bacterium]|nr:Lrp/AsnC family transcriptional regulator [candidate division KSB1 bacterium]MCB9509693.1 Lrp/AsnC family transcriptional regulator [Deferribacteres bacterium]
MQKSENNLDPADVKILNILQEDGRITNAALSANVGVSPSPMLERVKKLEKNGYIRKYVALIAPEKVGKGTIVFVTVSLAMHQLAALDNFTEAIRELPEVLECYHISGEADFLLKIAVSGIESYRDFVVNKLTPIAGIDRIRTAFVLDTVKHSTKILVDD